MDKEKLYNKINDFFSDRKIEFEGTLFSFDKESHTEFKFKILGSKKLILYGDEVDFTVVSVYNVKSTSDIFELMAKNIELTSNYYLKSVLEDKLEKILSVFDIYHVVITKIEPAEDVKL